MRAHGDLTHRDEIHGDVDYDPLAAALLDTDAMQRLGRVYQLGYGHLIYRGGTHSRLSHCMGSYATAIRIVAALERGYRRRGKRPRGAIEPTEFLPSPPGDDGRELVLAVDRSSLADELADRWAVLRSLVGWAGLVHDLGHVPLGHTLEDEFEGIYEKHDSFTSPRLRHIWLAGADGARSEIAEVLRRRDLYPEAFAKLGMTNGDDVWESVFLICTWKEKIAEGTRTPFEQILGEELDRTEGASPVAERLLAAHERLSGTLFKPYMADIVANTISADYLDYLRRDPHNLGLDVLRDDRVVSRFLIGRDHLGQQRMALSLVDRRGKNRLDTCTGVVELVRQRFRFAEIVYYHKTKVSASAMLARVFEHLGAPSELPNRREVPNVDAVPAVVEELLATSAPERRKRLDSLKSSLLPGSLLDAEIGDETLHLLLRYQAWEMLQGAVKQGDVERAEDALIGISLLDALAKRQLHKVAFTMDYDAFAALSGKGGSSDHECERALKELINRLRKEAGIRERIEDVLAGEAGGWPDASFLLYVPPRKSQAKGIDTGALAKEGTVIPLGDHPAVRDQVAELNQRYQSLWRLIVLVAPKRASDAIGLSRAIDGLVSELFPGASVDSPQVVNALTECCWFQYLAQRDRVAAAGYQVFMENQDADEVDWHALRHFDELLEGGATDEERSLGAALLMRAARQEGDMDRASATVKRHFAAPGSLLKSVDDRRERIAASASFLGSDDVPAEMMATIAALDELCTEICGRR